MMGIPLRYGIDTLPINRNRNVKHKTETETERTPKKKQKKKFETSAFGGASRCVFFRSNLSSVVPVEMPQEALEGRRHPRCRSSFAVSASSYLPSGRSRKQPFTDLSAVMTRGSLQ